MQRRSLVFLVLLGLTGVLALGACTRPAVSLLPLQPTTTATLPPTVTATFTPAATPTLTLPPNNLAVQCIRPNSPRMEAKVIQVIDGDTIVVISQGQMYRVRYLGIDTPETHTNTKKAHPWGPPAHLRNRELVGGKQVLLVADPISDDRDRHGRLLRYVLVGNIFVNLKLVEEGLAWLYPAPHSCEDLFVQVKERAKAAKIGVWSGATPTPIPTPTP